MEKKTFTTNSIYKYCYWEQLSDRDKYTKRYIHIHTDLIYMYMKEYMDEIFDSTEEKEDMKKKIAGVLPNFYDVSFCTNFIHYKF